MARTAAELIQELEERYGPWKNPLALIIRFLSGGPAQLIGPPVWDDSKHADSTRKAKVGELEDMLKDGDGEAVGFIESHPGGADGFTVRIELSPLREYLQDPSVSEFLSRLAENLRHRHVVSLREDEDADDDSHAA